MTALAAVLATLLAAAMVGVQPVAGRRRYQHLLKALAADPAARLRHYRRGIIGEWLAFAGVAVIGALAGRSPASIGLTTTGFGKTGAEVVEAAAVLAGSTILFRLDALREAIRVQTRGFIALLPRTSEERWTFAGVAVTAGICEEVLFRGFGIAYVRWLWPGATHGWLILLTSVAFGFAHLYQGLRGVVLTGIVGAFFASLVLSSGSLLPAVLLHALLDLRVLALPDLQSSPPS